MSDRQVIMGRRRILIVDDELVFRESLAGWLERAGYEVETTADYLMKPTDIEEIIQKKEDAFKKKGLPIKNMS
jgi:CheY-like chemotaxis protein